ncbi:MAG: type I-U CRISPR-associated protein Csb2 [Gammaproteobacteria bacterium]|nr:type I-U CRISPR-associated protein Csb2 [Gammaproteobacteria bacterium]
MMFALELQLLTGRYVATCYNDRRRAEWPPHPARLFSALAATHFASEESDPVERRALEWLESLGAPEMSASEAFPREEHVVFVPVNDLSVVGGFDKQETALAEAEAAVFEKRHKLESTAGHPKQQTELEKSLQKAEKKARVARSKLQTTVATKIQAPIRIGKEDAATAAALLPGHRLRQRRWFPGVTPDSSVVQFVWRNAEAESHARVLDQLAARVVRLGHSSSFVSLRVVNEPAPVNHLPMDTGPLRLRVIQAGQLQRLEAAFALHRESEPRIMPKAFQGYAPRPEPETTVQASDMGEDWLVLERISGPLLPATRGPDMARAVRGALLTHAMEPLPEVLTGYQPNGAPSCQAHLAIAPLPFVGHQHADGLLRGVAIILPRHLGLEEKKATYQALRDWEETARADADESDAPLLHLRLGTLGIIALRRVDYFSHLQALRPDTWCRRSRKWASVSPVALDRNPGDLRSRDPDKQSSAVRAAEQSVREACGRIGLPDPVRVDVLPFAPWAGVYKAKHFAPFPRGVGKTLRVLTHVYVEFPEPVRGPVILGAGRFLGLGLCKPLASDDE